VWSDNRKLPSLIIFSSLAPALSRATLSPAQIAHPPDLPARRFRYPRFLFFLRAEKFPQRLTFRLARPTLARSIKWLEGKLGSANFLAVSRPATGRLAASRSPTCTSTEA
jgi:hypothetical protein